ncbi:MAG: hypothetical protein MZV70_08895 [Desulfobacterales bacterium]|nr:hypothetical protein [Desulfobacterales bacterium]
MNRTSPAAAGSAAGDGHRMEHHLQQLPRQVQNRRRQDPAGQGGVLPLPEVPHPITVNGEAPAPPRARCP